MSVILAVESLFSVLFYIDYTRDRGFIVNVGVFIDYTRYRGFIVNIVFFCVDYTRDIGFNVSLVLCRLYKRSSVYCHCCNVGYTNDRSFLVKCYPLHEFTNWYLHCTFISHWQTTQRSYCLSNSLRKLQSVQRKCWSVWEDYCAGGLRGLMCRSVCEGSLVQIYISNWYLK